MAYKRILTGEPVPRNLPPQPQQEDLFSEPAAAIPPQPTNSQHSQADNRPGTISDPRPDLAEDTGLWSQVFTLAMAIDVKAKRRGNPLLFGALHGMRCAGTRLVQSEKSGKLVFRPLVGPGGWPSEAEYKQAAGLYLKPFDRDMKDLLEQLNRQEDAEARRDCPWG